MAAIQHSLQLKITALAASVLKRSVVYSCTQIVQSRYARETIGQTRILVITTANYLLRSLSHSRARLTPNAHCTCSFDTYTDPCGAQDNVERAQQVRQYIYCVLCIIRNVFLDDDDYVLVYTIECVLSTECGTIFYVPHSMWYRTHQVRCDKSADLVQERRRFLMRASIARAMPTCQPIFILNFLFF